MPRRVVITGFGGLCSLGRNVEQIRIALSEGLTGIRRLDTPFPGTVNTRVGARIPGFLPQDHFSENELAHLDRFAQFALLAADEASAASSLGKDSLRQAACIIGTGCGGKHTDDDAYLRLYRQRKSRLHPLTIPKGMPSAAASQVTMRLGIQGPSFSITSACSSAGHAISQSLHMIRSGLVEVSVTGGTDAPFTYGLLKAWEAMRILAPDTCRPFSADRKGLVLGEGAGIVILESEEHALRRGAQIYAELAGCGMSSDAAHITDSSVDGAARAMRAALRDAEVRPNDVDYINAHGTGTILNDLSETRAIRIVFGRKADHLAVSSTKSMHGHTLGAAGALELIATVLAINNNEIPPTANYLAPAMGCELDYVPNQARPAKIDVALSNSFAFGGLNSVLVVRRWADT